ncbi:hypothetical protein Ahia01_001009600 [Argonauta hians]
MEETLQYAAEIESLLTDCMFEKDRVSDIFSGRNEIMKDLQKSKDSIQNDIDYLEKQRKTVNEEHTQKGMFTPKEKEIEVQVEQANQRRLNAAMELEKCKEYMLQCQSQLSKMSLDRENMWDKESSRLEKLKYDIHLYTHITGIRWQYDTEADDIRGYISKHGFLKPFSLSSQKNSSFFVANYLWDLMEQN